MDHVPDAMVVSVALETTVRLNLSERVCRTADRVADLPAGHITQFEAL